MSLSLVEQKQQLRTDMRALRQARRGENKVRSAELANIFLNNINLPPRALVAAYHAFHDEADPAPLIAELRRRGHTIALPVIFGQTQSLAFYLYDPGDPLAANAMGIMQPVIDGAAPVEPDIVLAPLLAFDKNRNRLGYGGGYYDRTLAALRRRKNILATGIGHDYQQVPQVPTGPYDAALDHIVTNLNIF